MHSQTSANGVVGVYSYDALDRLAGVAHSTSGSSNILSETYTYDGNSNMLERTSNGVNTYYTYDGANQITYEGNNYPWTSASQWTKYSYDSNGNRTSRIKGSYGTYNTTDIYAYDAGDKLNTITTNGSLSRQYTYDGCGRPTTIATTSTTMGLAYDYEDRVTSVTGLAHSNSYGYNALDARVSKIDSGGSFTYLRDGADPTDDVLSDGTGAYVPGVSRRDSAGTRFFHDDFLGTHKAQTDSSQTTQATTSYDAFGNLTTSTGSPKGNFGFAGGWGYQEDSDTGFKLLGHRYYDPTIGRFLTRDPDEETDNWMVYCGNQPLGLIDPFGLDAAAIAAMAVHIVKNVGSYKRHHSYIEIYDSKQYGKNHKTPAYTDCGVFVSCCARTTDPDFPINSTSEIRDHLEESDNWKEVTGQKYKPGDIAIKDGHVIVQGSDRHWYNASLGDHPPERRYGGFTSPPYSVYRWDGG